MVLKQKTIVSLTLMTQLAFANDMKKSEQYREEIEKMFIEGKTEHLQNIKDILVESENSDINLIHAMNDVLKNNSKIAVNQNDVIKELTGKKNEVFCKNRGLVHLEAKLNSGQKFIVLQEKMEGIMDVNQFSKMKIGKFHYRLKKGDNFLESVITVSPHSQYFISERYVQNTRQMETFWYLNSTNNYFYDQYETANEYFVQNPKSYVGTKHLYSVMHFMTWGTPDAGFEINFEQENIGKKVLLNWSYPVGGSKQSSVLIQGKRLIKKHLEIFNGLEDCFEVETFVTFVKFQ